MVEDLRAVRMPLGVVVHVEQHTFPEPGTRKAACGASTHANRAGHPVTIDHTKPLGTTDAGVQLRWCGKCLGVIAVTQGRGEWLADAVVRSAS